ncbi:uncharacterized protein EV420DRAFT_1648185 [Desarmillaria tabescens]|uniref:Uncharacterized protein n=4 Tax=Physalacriaceae TaxID=862241 RepID=A0AA39JNE7_ARMTA|nr:uncharacterized protein EV420DRAFT_1648185 [Desarmillaria tabescens]KAK0445960.1 hypothetical protein EV420DRAFT_1648185 [Desarmillaria tabescens]
MSAPETKFAPTQSSSVLGGQIVGRSERQAVAPPAALKLRLDLNLEVEIAIQAKVNGDITLSLLKWFLDVRRRTRRQYNGRMCTLVISVVVFVGIVPSIYIHGLP